MKKKKAILTLIFSVFLLSLLNSCRDDALPKEDADDPCIICPIDFNATDSEPAWSPDGEWIAFGHGDVPGKVGIYLISPDGQRIQQWHQGPANAPAWSPDGQWIAFSENAQIWKKKLNGDSLTQLTFEGQNFDPSWNAERNLIAYRRSYSWPEEKTIQGIWILDLCAKNTSQIFSGNCGSPAWLNHESLVFFRGVIDSDGYVLGSTLYKIILKTSLYVELKFIPDTDNRYPKYSSASNKIVFTSKTQYNPYYQIWTMNADGSDLKQLTNTQGYSCDWSPDGTHIVFTDSRAESGRLWIMDADGSNKRQLTFEHHFEH